MHAWNEKTHIITREKIRKGCFFFIKVVFGGLQRGAKWPHDRHVYYQEAKNISCFMYTKLIMHLLMWLEYENKYFIFAQVTLIKEIWCQNLLIVSSIASLREKLCFLILRTYVLNFLVLNIDFSIKVFLYVFAWRKFGLYFIRKRPNLAFVIFLHS